MFNRPTFASRLPLATTAFVSSLAVTVGVGCASTSETKTDTAPATTAAEQPTNDDSLGELATIAPVAGPMSEAAKAIVADADRTPEDVKSDARRHPAETLTFAGIAPGMTVADLGAGSGYTTELLARAVGPDGKVFAQNNKSTIEKWVSKSWPARLERAVNANVVRVDREFADPLPEEASNLDAVTILFSYHDVVADKEDRGAMNAAVFNALKPGGVYVIADHSAPKASGLEAADGLHRLREELIRSEVEAAGFAFVADAQFLRDPTDDLTKISYKVGFKTDRYILKFQKPAE